MKKIFLSLIAGLISVATGASEIDSFTQRYDNLQDVGPVLDARTNVLLDRAISRANRIADKGADDEDGNEAVGCSAPVLYRSVRKELGRRFIGQLEVFVHQSAQIDKRRMQRKKTIYRDFRFYEAPSMGTIGRISAIVRVQDNIVGSDKFGHFFAQGYGYFKRAYLDGKGVESALRFGELSERVFLGALTTGVYSYADLAANFNGLQFWTQLVAGYADPMGADASSKGPYVHCKDNRWQRRRHFTWADYIDAAWDEGVNCNAFRNRTLLHRVSMRLTELERQTGHPMRCPVSISAAAMLKDKYGRYFPRLVNLEGNQSLTGLLHF
ncbi:MAG TPA: hypothetical protein ENI80_00730 [Acidiferrobacteraceae bacterium]|nr:hypothetical protein [Acidiferrobacteraceae bacterium]